MEKLLDDIRDFVKKNRNAVVIAATVVFAIVSILLLCCSRRTVAHGADSAHGVEWTFYSDGTLEFSGDGEVIGLQMSYVSDSAPAVLPRWYAYRDEVEFIEVEKGISRVGADAFVDFTALRQLTVRGMNTELDIECVRFDTQEGWELFQLISVAGLDGSQAQSYAEFNALEFIRL